MATEHSEIVSSTVRTTAADRLARLRNKQATTTPSTPVPAAPVPTTSIVPKVEAESEKEVEARVRAMFRERRARFLEKALPAPPFEWAVWPTILDHLEELHEYRKKVRDHEDIGLWQFMDEECDLPRLLLEVAPGDLIEQRVLLAGTLDGDPGFFDAVRARLAQDGHAIVGLTDAAVFEAVVPITCWHIWKGDSWEPRGPNARAQLIARTATALWAKHQRDRAGTTALDLLTQTMELPHAEMAKRLDALNAQADTNWDYDLARLATQRRFWHMPRFCEVCTPPSKRKKVGLTLW